MSFNFNVFRTCVVQHLTPAKRTKFLEVVSTPEYGCYRGSARQIFLKNTQKILRHSKATNKTVKPLGYRGSARQFFSTQYIQELLSHHFSFLLKTSFESIKSIFFHLLIIQFDCYQNFLLLTLLPFQQIRLRSFHDKFVNKVVPFL